jgi:hypothetical protein
MRARNPDASVNGTDDRLDHTSMITEPGDYR